MNRSIKTGLNRAKELLEALEAEYQECLDSKTVTARAEQLTHDLAERLRSTLDQTARAYWDQKVAPDLDEAARDKAKIYFPIVETEQSLKSVLGRWRLKDASSNHDDVLSFLGDRQPYADKKWRILKVLDKLATAGKHIGLIPQTREKTIRTTVTGPGGKVSYDSNVKFGGGVSIMGAPIDPRTQRIVPTPGVEDKVEVWVSFLLPDDGVNALGFAKEALALVESLIEEFWAEFELSET